MSPVPSSSSMPPWAASSCTHAKRNLSCSHPFLFLFFPTPLSHDHPLQLWPPRLPRRSHHPRLSLSLFAPFSSSRLPKPRSLQFAGPGFFVFHYPRLPRIEAEGKEAERSHSRCAPARNKGPCALDRPPLLRSPEQRQAPLVHRHPTALAPLAVRMTKARVQAHRKAQARVQGRVEKYGKQREGPTNAAAEREEKQTRRAGKKRRSQSRSDRAGIKGARRVKAEQGNGQPG